MKSSGKFVSGVIVGIFGLIFAAAAIILHNTLETYYNADYVKNTLASSESEYSKNFAGKFQKDMKNTYYDCDAFNSTLTNRVVNDAESLSRSLTAKSIRSQLGAIEPFFDDMLPTLAPPVYVALDTKDMLDDIYAGEEITLDNAAILERFTGLADKFLLGKDVSINPNVLRALLMTARDFYVSEINFSDLSRGYQKNILTSKTFYTIAFYAAAGLAVITLLYAFVTLQRLVPRLALVVAVIVVGAVSNSISMNSIEKNFEQSWTERFKPAEEKY